MKKWFKSNKLYFMGSMLGAMAGYIYWQHIGCSTVTCSITSKPINGTLFGAMPGALLLIIFKKENMIAK